MSEDGRPARPVQDGRPEHLRAAIDASLRRLGVDHVDPAARGLQWICNGSAMRDATLIRRGLRWPVIRPDGRGSMRSRSVALLAVLASGAGVFLASASTAQAFGRPGVAHVVAYDTDNDGTND